MYLLKKTPSSGCWATQSQHWTSVMSTAGLVLKPSVARLKWHLAMMAEGSCLSLQHCSTACLLRCKKLPAQLWMGHMLHSSCSISPCWTSATLPAECKVHGSQQWNEKHAFKHDCAYLAHFGKRIHELVLVPVSYTLASYTVQTLIQA